MGPRKQTGISLWLSSLEDLQTFGRPFPSHASGALCYKEARSCWELPTITQQVGCGIHVESWSSFFLLNPHPAWVSVLPWDFMFLFCTACLCSRKDVFFFFFLFPHMSVVENQGAFVKCTVLHSPCSSLFDDLILRGKRDSEEENLLSALNPGFWPFFAKTVSCRLFSDPNLPVLRTRNKSLHKNPRVCFQVFEGKFWSPVELFGGVCYFTRDRAECLWFTLLLRSLFYVLLWFSDFSWFGFGKVKSRQGVGK